MTSTGADPDSVYVADSSPFNVDMLKARGERVLALAEGINGPSTFDVESAAYGYIQGWQKLVVPKYVHDMLDDPALKSTSKQLAGVDAMTLLDVLFVAFCNYVKLRKGSETADADSKLEERACYWIAMYRARLVKQGYLYKSKEARAVTVDELHVQESAANPLLKLTKADDRAAFSKDIAVPAQAAMALKAYYETITEAGPDGKPTKLTAWSRFISLYVDRPKVAEDIVFTAEQVSAATYLVFRQFGHHYQASLKEKYEIMWKATTLAKPEMLPDLNAVHRIAIHSFGMRALHDKFWYNYDNGKLAETYRDRSTVAPCGAAQLMTANAALSLMEALPIWNTLYMGYATQIDTVRAEAKKMGSPRDMIVYHKNAKLFGVERKKANNEAAIPVAPIIKGWLNFQGKEAAMAGQRTLNKLAEQNPAIVTLVEAVLTGVIDKIASSGDVSALSTAMPGTRRAIQGARIEEVDSGA